MTVETAALWTHIAAGVAALVAGGVALATEKGGRRHRRAGRVYVAAMAVVVATVLPLFALDPTFFRTFLLLVAVFSGYFAFSGYRVLAREHPSDGPETVDWAAAVAVVAACVTLGAWGAIVVASGDSFGVVMVVFGGIGGVLGTSDLRAYWRGTNRTWLVDHLSRMVGAYIATVTAVSVVNISMAPEVVAWLWPTAVGVPLIWYWQAEYADVGPLAGRI
ncbi:DUF2306 domain-containing protein [Halobacterium noricense]|uniref:DUF2306 domain-containing protein n=1 Tax=Halobacterium noricense TaxID=223182 RepID=UPI001E3B11B0|nr:DUF2306 domain-containing protein [Halobacterium noricense]UHH25658.1 DUF2306 domain-containing protein [Halobacterium noricense]